VGGGAGLVTRDLSGTIGVWTGNKVLNGNSSSGKACNTNVYAAMSQVVIVILILIIKANANRTSMTNTYCVYTMLRYN
jgi:hypothetical protein